MPEEESLIACIEKIKGRFQKHEQFKKIMQRQAKTAEKMEEKMRAMCVAFQIISEQNCEHLRAENNFRAVLSEKNNEIELRDIEIKKYKEQLLEAFRKNEQLTTYCRQLAHEYNILLNTMKNNEEVCLYRQTSASSKLKTMENQVTFLRQNVLKNSENLSPKSNKLKNRTKSKRKSANKPKQSQIRKDRKSLVQILQ